MMNLSEDQINEIEVMAELFYSPEDIAINIEVDSANLRAQFYIADSAASKAYMTGWLKGDITLRKSIAQAAANGSNPAQQMMLDFQRQNKINL